MMADEVNILGFAGSLRKQSYNRSALRAAVKLVPADIALETFDLSGLPPFNEDHEKDPPAPVRQFKAAVKAADAILIATPEYNYSVPGVLKNAIDWASRPYGDNAWNGKPVGIMGASIGMLGTGRAQYHLRQMFVFLNMYPLNQPEVMIANADEKFDEQGNLKHDKTAQKIRELLEALADWARTFKKIRT
ncbi:MAG TPA: NAD(P)H-dependent oxidoreductase [Nitrospiraceae bacterium]|nr:NAD(P)H-dependent oxidoreductase [Nitrospiraceae bacterium]